MNINNFFVAGINYKKADAEIRGLFAIDNIKYAAILSEAASLGINEVFVLSTCNRTEIYGLTDSANILIDLLCSQTAGNISDFKKSAYIKSGNDAVEHLFNVGAGLDSQILGDYEIVGQLKNSIKLAKQHTCIGLNFERLINSVLQASKSIKNNTQLSSGTVSVAFAAVQYIRSVVKNISDKKILLLGAGKIGSIACRNIIDYLGTKNITLINRSDNKAFLLAQELDIQTASINNLQTEIDCADIILVATNAPSPVILQSHFINQKEKLIIDLSIPFNVEESVRNISFIKLVNVDELSQLKDKTLRKREAEIPKAKAIIADAMREFYDWREMRRHVPMLKDLKHKLKEIHNYSKLQDASVCCNAVDIKIQKVVNETAGKMKTDNQKGCQFISAINEFIRTA